MSASAARPRTGPDMPRPPRGRGGLWKCRISAGAEVASDGRPPPRSVAPGGERAPAIHEGHGALGGGVAQGGRPGRATRLAADHLDRDLAHARAIELGEDDR